MSSVMPCSVLTEEDDKDEEPAPAPVSMSIAVAPNKAGPPLGTFEALRKERQKHHLVEAEPTSFYRPAQAPHALPTDTTQHVFVEFVLDLLHYWLKHNRFNKQDATVVAMLDPLLPRLTRCIASKFNKTAILALKVRCWALCAVRSVRAVSVL